MHLENTLRALRERGFTVSHYATAQEAARAIAAGISGKTVGMGGSVTLQQLGLYPLLQQNNTVFWHWVVPGPETLAQAAAAQVYLSSVNGLAETGELVNIDGTGNRVAATLYGHEKVIFVVGANKLAPDLPSAISRARNLAAPLNARRLQRQTPCALTDPPRCHDCQSPQRICRAMSILMEKVHGVGEMEVVLVDEELGY